MAVLNLRELERSEGGKLIGQGGEHILVYPQSQDVHVHAAPLRPKTLRERVYEAVSKSDRAVTRNQIAKLLGTKNNSWLHVVMTALVVDGYLVCTYDYCANGMKRYWYEVKR